MRVWCARLAAGLMLTAAKGALAFTCTTVTPSTVIQPKTLSVPRDLPIGWLIAQVVSDPVSAFNCVNSEPVLDYQEVGVKAYGTYFNTWDNKRVYKTNIKGIGYAIGVRPIGDECDYLATGHWVSGYNAPDLDFYGYCKVKGLYPVQPMKFKALINFYKIADTTGTGVISGKQVGAFTLKNQLSLWVKPEAAFSIGDIQVTTLSCTLGSKTIAVNMGSVPISSFKGPGTAQPSFRDRAFSIPLTCPTGVSINVQIDGTAHDPAQGMLKLDAGPSSATGVAVQVLYDDKPLELAKRFKWQETDADGTYEIPFKARYVQTESSVKPGAANASATFTVTYQ